MKTDKKRNDTDILDRKIISSIIVKRKDKNKYPVIITILPLLSMLAAIWPEIMKHAAGTDIAKIGIITMILTGAVTFYIRLSNECILDRKLAKTIIIFGYLGAICLLLLVPNPEVFSFWMIGGLVTAMLIDNKLGLLFNFNMTFIMGIALNARPEVVIQILIICVLMSILAGALKNKSTVIYAVIIILSINVTLAFAINNFIFEKITNYNYVYSLFSILAVLVTAFFISVSYQKSMNKQETGEASSNHPSENQTVYEDNQNLQKQNIPLPKSQDRTVSKDIDESHSTDVNENQSTDVNENHSTDVNENHSTDANENHSTDANENHSTDANENHNTDANESHITDANENHSADVNVNHSVDINENHNTDVNENHSINESYHVEHSTVKEENEELSLQESAAAAETDRRDIGIHPERWTSYEVLCDLDNELLKRLNQYSESIYTHSLRIGDLSFRAAKEIGANELLAKAGGLYHEIGKIYSKNYIEEGLKLSEEYAFPKELKSILKEHNIKYEKPNSVEAAIVMLSDNVVSTIDYIEKTGDHKYTVNKVIENIFQMRLDKGNFDSSGLSIKDYKLLKEFYQAEFNQGNPEVKKIDSN